jgi:crotonobetainyl-CoA:carnitine CoA-transferase CaiB-like acyl-CoA transferase
MTSPIDSSTAQAEGWDRHWDEHWAHRTEAMARPDLRESEGLRRLQGRIARIDEVTVADWTATRTREEVSVLCDTHHVPVAPWREVMAVLADPHLRARGFLMDHLTDAGPVALPNRPIRDEGSALRPLTSSPSLGQHTDEVLPERCGLDEAALADLRRAGGI